MSNQVNIVRTKFTNLRTGEETYGVRVYDDYGKEYCNLWEKHEVPDDDLDLLEKCFEFEAGTKDGGPIDHLQEVRNGVEIDGHHYDWEQIKHLFP